MLSKTFNSSIKIKVVLIHTDNTTVATYLNKQGGTKSWELCALLWRILTWCKKRKITLQASHIAGKLNVLADQLSRSHQVIQTEWSLHPQIFKDITKIWGTPQIDLFATHMNKKLPLYVSPFQDQMAWKVDAMTISWENLHFYAYPPTKLLPQVIQKIKTETCQGIIIAPNWPKQSWYANLLSISQEDPIKLPQVRRLLKQPHLNVFHQHLQFLNLHAWKVSSHNLKNRAFPKK